MVCYFWICDCYCCFLVFFKYYDYFNGCVDYYFVYMFDDWDFYDYDVCVDKWFKLVVV